MTRPRDQILELLLKEKAYNIQDKFVHFDFLWQDPAKLILVSNWLKDFILTDLSHCLPEDKYNLILLSPDNVRSDYGIIPITVTVANLLECRIAIWKEFADMKWGKSFVIGPDVPNLKCIVLQHVVRNGTTAVRVAHGVKERHWDFLA